MKKFAKQYFNAIQKKFNFVVNYNKLLKIMIMIQSNTLKIMKIYEIKNVNQVITKYS